MSNIYIVSFCQAVSYNGFVEIEGHVIFTATTESQVVQKAIKYLDERDFQIPSDLVFNFASLKGVERLNNNKDSEQFCSFKFEQL